jgi:transposase
MRPFCRACAGVRNSLPASENVQYPIGAFCRWRHGGGSPKIGASILDPHGAAAGDEPPAVKTSGKWTDAELKELGNMLLGGLSIEEIAHLYPGTKLRSETKSPRWAEPAGKKLLCRRALGQAQTVLGQDPFSGHVFCFRGRRGDLVKLLWWDGDGLCLFAKRLERGRFVWPRAEEGVVVLSRAQLSMLLEGIDWRMPRRTWRPELAG